MKTEGKRHNVTSLAALLVFTVFTLCVLLVLLTGAKVYRGVTERAQIRADAATAVRYLTTRVHQADRVNGLLLEAFGDSDALVLLSEVDGEVYETRIYCHNGWLCELFSPRGAGLSPADGEQILSLQNLSFHLQDRTLEVAFEVGGETQTLLMTLRAQQEDTP